MDLKEKVAKVFTPTIYPMRDKGNLLAVVSLDVLGLVNLTVMLRRSQRGGYFLSWPGYKSNTGEWRDYIRTTSAEVTQALTDLVVSHYERLVPPGTTGKRPPLPKDEDWPL